MNTTADPMPTGGPTAAVRGPARLPAAGARAVTRGLLSRPPWRRRAASGLFQALLFLAFGTAVLTIAALVTWAVVTGWPRLDRNLILGYPSTVFPETAGYRPAIIGSLYVIGGVILLIVPLGVGGAVWLEEYADRTRWYHRLIELNVQNLAGVPSIVYGLLGVAFIVRGPLNLGFVAMAGSLTLALLVLPTVILAAREALRAVPNSIRAAALALGATRWQTVRHQVLPAARPGILTGVILAVARAFGEAAPLLLVGAVTFLTFDPLPISGGYSTLPVQVYSYATRPQEELRVLAAAGVVVILTLVLLVNLVAVWLRDRYERRV